MDLVGRHERSRRRCREAGAALLIFLVDFYLAQRDRGKVKNDAFCLKAGEYRPKHLIKQRYIAPFRIFVYTKQNSSAEQVWGVNEVECREALERLRWPEGPVCPHCGSKGPDGPVAGTSARPGLYMCPGCRKQFTVTVGTPLESSKLPLSTWLRAAHLLSAHEVATPRQLQTALGVTYKTAWGMVDKLMATVEKKKYRGPLKHNNRMVFGGAVSARIEPYLPKNRNTISYWKRKQRRIAEGTYKEPSIPRAVGVLRRRALDPDSTQAHIDRTERFMAWVLGVR